MNVGALVLILVGFALGGLGLWFGYQFGRSASLGWKLIGTAPPDVHVLLRVQRCSDIRDIGDPFLTQGRKLGEFWFDPGTRCPHPSWCRVTHWAPIPTLPREVSIE